MTAFWDVAPQAFTDVSEALIALMMEAVSTSETSVNFYLPDYTAQQHRRQSSS
jgi:hypothetical protein